MFLLRPAALLFSRPYVCAMCAGVTEYLLELWLLGPQLKQQQAVALAGLLLAVTGEALRKTAMVRVGVGVCAREGQSA